MQVDSISNADVGRRTLRFEPKELDSNTKPAGAGVGRLRQEIKFLLSLVAAQLAFDVASKIRALVSIYSKSAVSLIEQCHQIICKLLP
jgi:hypothetical protein